MTDEPDEPDEPTPGQGQHRDHPVLLGIGALVAVSIVVGLILAGGAIAATRVLGVSGDTAGGPSTSPTLYLPDPTDTEGDDEPPLSLQPEPEQTTTPFRPEQEQTAISLSAGQTEVSAMQQIDLTGTYPGGEGAILQVQQFENGGWNDFPVTASVGGETFSTYIQTGQLGENRFRVVDTDTGKKSNEVKVRIG